MITLIAAMNKHQTIGLNGSMPWHNSEDLKHFKNYTMGKTVVMGRVTYEGLPHKLEGRNILVVSKDERYDIQDLRGFLEKPHSEEIVIAGGGQIYHMALPYADRLVISILHDNDVVGDTFFPKINNDDFNLVSETVNNTFTLKVYERKGVKYENSRDY
ncbi:MAG TPA: dihydrofolate reductase [Erysipelothrix sp.]|nr:dihydrofolate reductase [Erysipelothrix sp.]